MCRTMQKAGSRRISYNDKEIAPAIVLSVISPNWIGDVHMINMVLVHEAPHKIVQGRPYV